VKRLPGGGRRQEAETLHHGGSRPTFCEERTKSGTDGSEVRCSGVIQLCCPQRLAKGADRHRTGRPQGAATAPLRVTAGAGRPHLVGHGRPALCVGGPGQAISKRRVAWSIRSKLPSILSSGTDSGGSPSCLPPLTAAERWDSIFASRTRL
jgi:hypothetical protein